MLKNKKLLIILNYKKYVEGISGQIEQFDEDLKNEDYQIKLISTIGSLTKRIKGIL